MPPAAAIAAVLSFSRAKLRNPRHIVLCTTGSVAAASSPPPRNNTRPMSCSMAAVAMSRSNPARRRTVASGTEAWSSSSISTSTSASLFGTSRTREIIEYVVPGIVVTTTSPTASGP